jgi:hypothetical protein
MFFFNRPDPEDAPGQRPRHPVPIGDLPGDARAARGGTRLTRRLSGEPIAAGLGLITTEITGPPTPPFYFAEDYHQQYLSKNPGGYCPDHGTGVSCPIGVGVTANPG